MKIRNGFVSNSSSSSFVILLPRGFDIESIDMTAMCEQNDVGVESVKRTFRKFLKYKEIYERECRGSVIDVLYEILRPYTIASIETGPDEGRMVLADEMEIRKILGI